MNTEEILKVRAAIEQMDEETRRKLINEVNARLAFDATASPQGLARLFPGLKMYGGKRGGGMTG